MKQLKKLQGGLSKHLNLPQSSKEEDPDAAWNATAEGKALATVWQQYAQRPGPDALAKVLERFVQQCAKWSPTDATPLPPAALVRALCDHLSAEYGRLGDAGTASAAKQDALASAEAWRALRAVHILARAPALRTAVWEAGALDTASALLGAAAEALAAALADQQSDLLEAWWPRLEESIALVRQWARPDPKGLPAGAVLSCLLGDSEADVVPAPASVAMNSGRLLRALVRGPPSKRVGILFGWLLALLQPVLTEGPATAQDACLAVCTHCLGLPAGVTLARITAVQLDPDALDLHFEAQMQVFAFLTAALTRCPAVALAVLRSPVADRVADTAMWVAAHFALQSTADGPAVSGAPSEAFAIDEVTAAPPSLPGASPKLRVLCAQLLALAGRAGDVLEAAAALERSCEAEAVGEAATLRGAAEQLAAVCMFPFGTAATQDAAWKEVAALLEVQCHLLAVLADHVARALAEERAEASPGGWPGLQAVLTQQLYGLLLGPDFAPPAPGEAALGALRRSDQRRAFLYDALGFVLSRAAAFRAGPCTAEAEALLSLLLDCPDPYAAPAAGRALAFALRTARPAVEPPLLAMRAPHLVARAIGADGRRAALLNVLRVVLETGTARRAVVGDPDNAVPGTLLACTTDEAWQDFAISQYAGLLAVSPPPPLSPPDALRPLVDRYGAWLAGGPDPAVCLLALLALRDTLQSLREASQPRGPSSVAAADVARRQRRALRWLLGAMVPNVLDHLPTNGELRREMAAEIAKLLALLPWQALGPPTRLQTGLHRLIPDGDVWGLLWDAAVDAGRQTLRSAPLLTVALTLAWPFPTPPQAAAVERLLAGPAAVAAPLAAAKAARPLLAALLAAPAGPSAAALHACLAAVGAVAFGPLELKALLRSVVDAPSPAERVVYLRTAIRLLLALAPAPDGCPAATAWFELGGPKGGLRCPARGGWPDEDGYSIATWVRLPPDSATAPAGPTLFHLQAAGGNVVDGSFQAGHLVVTVQRAKDSVAAHELRAGTALRANRWTHVAVTHACGKGKFGLGSHSECHVYIDGQPAATSLLKYPREKGAGERCLIGTRHWPPAPGTPDATRLQATAVLLLREPLPVAAVQRLHTEGPDLRLELAAKGSRGLADIFSRVVIALDPRSCDGFMAHDLSPALLSPEDRDAPEDVAVADRLVPLADADAVVVRSGTLPDALDGLGGLPTLLPLFVALSDIAAVDGLDMAFRGGDCGALPPASPQTRPEGAAGLLEQLLAAVAHSVLRSPTAREQFVACHAAELLTFLLHPVADLVSVSCVEILHRLLHGVADHPAFLGLLRHVLLNLGLWVKTPAPTQLQATALVLEDCAQYAYMVPAMRKAALLAPLLDQLALLLAPSCDPDAALVARRTWLSLAAMMLRGPPPITRNEAATLVSYLSHCPSPSLLRDAVVQLAWPLRDDRAAVDHLWALGGPAVFAPLLAGPDVASRCAGAYLAHYLSTKKSRPLDLRSAGLLDALGNQPLPAPLYRALRGMLLGAAPDHPYPAAGCDPLPAGPEARVANPAVWLPLLDLVARQAEPGLQRLALKDLATLLRPRTTTVDVWLQQAGWPQAIQPFLGLSADTEVSRLAVEAAGAALFHALHTKEKGWRVVDEVLEALHTSQAGDPVGPLERVLVATLGHLVTELEAPKAAPLSSLALANLQHTLGLIEEQVFGFPLVRRLCQGALAEDAPGVGEELEVWETVEAEAEDSIPPVVASGESATVVQTSGAASESLDPKAHLRSRFVNFTRLRPISVSREQLEKFESGGPCDPRLPALMARTIHVMALVTVERLERGAPPPSVEFRLPGGQSLAPRLYGEGRGGRWLLARLLLASIAKLPATGDSVDARTLVSDCRAAVDQVVRLEAEQVAELERRKGLGGATPRPPLATLLPVTPVLLAGLVRALADDALWAWQEATCEKVFDIAKKAAFRVQSVLLPEWTGLVAPGSPLLELLHPSPDCSRDAVRRLLESEQWRKALDTSFAPSLAQQQSQEVRHALELQLRRPQVRRRWKETLAKAEAARAAADAARRRDAEKAEGAWQQVGVRPDVWCLPPADRFCKAHWASLVATLKHTRGLWMVRLEPPLEAAEPLSEEEVDPLSGSLSTAARHAVPFIRLDLHQQALGQRMKVQPDPHGTDHRGITGQAGPSPAPAPLPDRPAAPAADPLEEPPEDAAEAAEAEAAAATETRPAETEAQVEGTLQQECERVTPLGLFPGHLELSRQELWWCVAEGAQSSLATPATAHLIETPPTECWRLDDVAELWPRRHHLLRTALEFVFVDGSSAMFHLMTAEACHDFFRAILAHRPAGLPRLPHYSPEREFEAGRYTERWVRREMDNFEYLMWLNRFAGRTHNDLSQYPVFPWVLQDYSSPSLDLADPAVYRDLSQPMGWLGAESRREAVMRRYESLQEAGMPAYHYGSHYSTAGFVLYYLLRLEPFTTGVVLLQGGKFDYADRMFDSVAKTWASTTAGASDVKELIPEFYYLPEFLRNNNGVYLGRKQNGQQLGDVGLPPWANNDPVTFVRILREALESEHVSSHLDEWIDLIFGYKQRGSAARTAHNCFHPLTYEGSVKAADLLDPEAAAPILDQINNFGQTPIQLFRSKHPKRDPLPASAPPPLRQQAGQLQPLAPAVLLKGQPLAAVDAAPDGAVAGASLAAGAVAVATLPAAPAPRRGGPASAGPESGPDFASAAHSPTTSQSDSPSRPAKAVPGTSGLAQLPGTMLKLGAVPGKLVTGTLLPAFAGSAAPLAVLPLPLGWALPRPTRSPAQRLMALQAASAKDVTVLSADVWRGAAVLHRVAPGQARLAGVLAAHRRAVTCVALSADRSVAVTGSADTTCAVWLVGGRRGGRQPVLQSRLCGHDAAVLCVAVDPALDVVASGSADGTVILHSLHGRYERSIVHPQRHAIDAVAIAPGHGVVALYTSLGPALWLYSINGTPLATAVPPPGLRCLAIGPDGQTLLTAGAAARGEGALQLWALHDLSPLWAAPTPSPVAAVAFLPGGHGVVAGLDSGEAHGFALGDARFGDDA